MGAKEVVSPGGGDYGRLSVRPGASLVEEERRLQANGRDNIEMAFMYSECGNEWPEISSSIEANLYQRSRCAAQTRESSEGVTALDRGSLAPRSKKLLKYYESAILIN